VNLSDMLSMSYVRVSVIIFEGEGCQGPASQLRAVLGAEDGEEVPAPTSRKPRDGGHAATRPTKERENFIQRSAKMAR
jgi:hypothetical protein